MSLLLSKKTILLILLALSYNFSEKMADNSLKIGDKIPSFTLKDQNGIDFNIDTIIGKKSMVIYFYPKDETSVCTAQACSFRDSYEAFNDLGAEVIGISSDSVESHKSFAKNHQLPFILLSDSKQKVRKQFGVPKDMFGLLPGRYTYVANKKGEIILIFNSALNAQKHIEEAIKALKK